MKVAIIGYGREGKAVTEYFRGKKSAELFVCDANAELSLSPNKITSAAKIHLRTGPDYLRGLASYDLIFRSPGVPYLTSELQAVKEKLTSGTRYFFEKAPCPIIGVTGTKGKGTTCTLLYELLKKGYKKGRVFFGGNIGTPALGFLDELTPDDLVILELSSFQLQDLDRSPHIAVVLGVTEDHLDHHKNRKEYVDAKRTIAQHQGKNDMLIVDADDATALSFLKGSKARPFQISLDAHTEPGAFVKVGSLVINDGETGLIFGERGATGLQGEHNLYNILSAAMAAHLCGVPVEVIQKAVHDFKGLPHRLQLVRELKGARYYDDSASTNPSTTAAAVAAFSQPTTLIVGGSDKQADFAPMAKAIVEQLNVKTVIMMGQTAPKIEAALEKAAAIQAEEVVARIEATGRDVRRREVQLELVTAETYQEAFMVAYLTAQPGEVVLLSPGCASFDMFDSYEHRGEVFTRYIEGLGEE